MNEERFSQLLDQYVTGSIQAPERKEFFDLLEEPSYRAMLEKKMEEEWNSGAYEEEREQIGQLVEQYVVNRINEEKIVYEKPRTRIIIMRRMAAAAIVLLVFSVAGYYLLQNRKQPATTVLQDATPGSNKAVLVLADGKQMVLDSQQHFLSLQQGAAEVTQQQHGQLSYKAENNNAATVYNTVRTPRGGQYKIQLADGTWVWLNAASSMKFPTAFQGNTRMVEITGEAYFEVAHNDVQPFIVMANGTATEVLGTHFNINAYANESSVKTTLIEGKVKVSSKDKQQILKPGEQAAMADNISVQNADTEEVLAWKNGLFRFNYADIETVMNQVERWYDVEVVYEGPKPEGHFRGKVSRNVMASEMLKIIAASGVQFRIENKKVIIMK